MKEQLYNYELKPAVVNYIMKAVNSQQVRGEQEAKDLVLVLNLLREPANKSELEKEQLESLKEKYEPVTEKKEKK